MSAQNTMLADKRVSMSREALANLLKRIFQVVLILLILSVLLVLLVIYNQSLARPVLEWAGVATLGIAAGLAARWRLRSHTQTLKFLTAVLALAFNLWILGLVTAGLLGFTGSEGSTLGVNWRGLGQLALGTILAWMSLGAMRATVHANKPGKQQVKGSTKSGIKQSKQRSKEKKVLVKPGKPKGGYTANKSFAWPKSVIRLFDSIKAQAGNLNKNRLQRAGTTVRREWNDGISQMKSSLAKLHASGQQAHLAIRTKFTRKTQKTIVRLGTPARKVQPTVSGSKTGEIRLLGEIEHRCPFCLEIVEKNGPRGVKICKICNTYHHADCWEVTGTCQVPHHYG